MGELRKGSHTKTRLTVHLVWITKYRYKVLKGRSSHHLQKEFPHLKKRYWGCRFWGRGYGAFSTGNITEKMVQEYIEHHREGRNPNEDNDENFILE